VVDAGTATTLTYVDARGVLAGGAIMLGLSASAEELGRRGARLHQVRLEIPPSALGRSTVSSLQSGLVLGHAGAVRHLAELIDPGARRVVTGGWRKLVVELLPGAVEHGNLTAWGGRVYWQSCIRAHERPYDTDGRP
ncbi:MAG: type III pantothenate kinase, partial [Candidatus Sericytochromatia bacterium]|nr:type III pantothenate kinase [Candidatus Tanganyikabacteria bacterium]